MQVGMKVRDTGLNHTSPDGIISRAIAVYGATNVPQYIIDNKYKFSLFMSKMITVGTTEVDMATELLSPVYDDCVTIDCEDQPIGTCVSAYDYIPEQLILLGYITNVSSSIYQFTFRVNSYTSMIMWETDDEMATDGCSIAVCLSNQYLGGVGSFTCTCGSTPCNQNNSFPYTLPFTLG